MAEIAISMTIAESEVPELDTVSEVSKEEINSTVDMDLESATILSENDAEAKSKRAREDEGAEQDENGDGEAKKLKEDKSIEEKRLEELVGGAEEKKKEETPVSLGPKSFGSSSEMFDYFFKLLHSWSINTDLNKYEYMVLLDLLKKGHLEPEKKIGNGVRSFQVRNHPEFRSRCFFIVKDDYSVDDFSFRKCVDQISPLPDNLKVKSYGNKDMGGRFGGGRGRFGRGGGRGRGGRR